MNRNEFVHFHISHVGMDLSLGPCKQKVLVLFSSVVSFYKLLFCVISGDKLNSTSTYLIKMSSINESRSFILYKSCCAVRLLV